VRSETRIVKHAILSCLLFRDFLDVKREAYSVKRNVKNYI